MPRKKQGSGRISDRSGDFDTSSQSEPQGAGKPGQAQPRLPHERDESATATGNRMDEAPPPSSRRISEARKNAEEGQLDTDRRGIPNDIPSKRRR